MSVNVRIDSLYQFADPIFDETQEEYVWGISDPPDPQERDDDQFYIIRAGDRLDKIAHELLGSARYFWIIMHYNDIQNAMDLDNFVGEEIRMPSRTTLERIFVNAAQQSSASSDNS